MYRYLIVVTLIILSLAASGCHGRRIAHSYPGHPPVQTLAPGPQYAAPMQQVYYEEVTLGAVIADRLQVDANQAAWLSTHTVQNQIAYERQERADVERELDGVQSQWAAQVLQREVAQAAAEQSKDEFAALQRAWTSSLQDEESGEEPDAEVVEDSESKPEETKKVTRGRKYFWQY